MHKNQYWEAVNGTRWWEPLIFYSVLATGIIIYVILDSFVIRAASAQLTSWWLNLSGFPLSHVDLSFPRVLLSPEGESGIQWSINSTSTPQAGLFPFLCLLAVPRTRLATRARNYGIFATVLFLAISIISAIEFREYHLGNPSLLSNTTLNQNLMYGLGAAALVSIFLLWPQTTIPFVYYPNLIANGIRSLLVRHADPGSRSQQFFRSEE